MQEQEVRIEYVPLSDLQRWPRNPKLHSLNTLQDSIERFGYVQPLLVDERTGKLVAGHGRLDALQARKSTGKPPPARVLERNGEWLVPVIRGVQFESVREAEAYLLADNRLVELGGWEGDMLVEMLSEHRDVLSGTGFTEPEIQAMLGSTPPPTDNDLVAGFGATDAPSTRLDRKQVRCPSCGHEFAA